MGSTYMVLTGKYITADARESVATSNIQGKVHSLSLKIIQANLDFPPKANEYRLRCLLSHTYNRKHTYLRNLYGPKDPKDNFIQKPGRLQYYQVIF